MEPLSVAKIKEATGGVTKFKKFDKMTVASAETDTRSEDLRGGLFIALRGPNFDGHDFIDVALDKGAACVLSEREKDLERDAPVVFVKSSCQALKDLAKYYRSNFNIPIAAVTGSTGKTTVKDLVASVLSTKYHTFKTEGNFNNEIGLPLSVLRMDKTCQAAVFEMGMNHFGEIHNLAEILRPDICVITNIGDAHIEFLGSREGILKAKLEILDFRTPRTQIILNGDDPLLAGLRGQYPHMKYYGLGEGNYFTAEQLQERGLSGVSCAIRYDNARFFVKIPLPGRHMALNALAAAAVGHLLNVSPSSVKNGIENFRPSKNRMNIKTRGGITVINDAYNASPASVTAAIDVMSGLKNRKVCVLGDMLELGDKAPEFHRQVGEYAVKNGMDFIVCVGELAEYIYKGAESAAAGRARYFPTVEELLPEMGGIAREGDTVLIKASRAMRLEKIAEVLS